MKTTLNKIRAKSPCRNGWSKLLEHLNKTKADDEPLDLLVVLKSNGLDDALWCLRAVDGYEREIRLYAVWCDRQVQHLITDRLKLEAIDVAERYAHGNATDKDLTDALVAVSYESAGSCSAAYEARNAAYAAAWAAAREATWSASSRVEARVEAWDAVRSAQQVKFIEFCGECK